jgi:hypothetical protein
MPRAKIRLPLLAIVAAAMGLIAARMIWPKLHFDTTSLILFGIAAVAWALAYAPVKKLKFGDFEAELEPMIAALGQKVIASEAAATVQSTRGDRVLARDEIIYRDGGSTSYPDSRPIDSDDHGATDAAVDVVVNTAFKEFTGIVGSAAEDRDKIVRVADLIERLSRERIIDPATRTAVEDLQALRNSIWSGEVPVTPADTLILLDYAWRLLRSIVG